MHLRWTNEQQQFRARAREWLEANVPDEPRPPHGLEQVVFDQAWQRRQYDEGWAGISWPREHGGLGLSLLHQVIWFEETRRARAPAIGANFIGLSHAGPTLIEFAGQAQKAHHLPRILKGEALWCQGFSEPEAGSDLASLKMRAVVDGDCLVVSGQKIWTSYAQTAHYQELLVRTSHEGRKHDGISWVIGDLGLPGIDIRPITTMDQTDHFCEVFYDDVRIPLVNVVGGIDNGWRVAMANLGFERATSRIEAQIDLDHAIDDLVEFARSARGDGARPLIEDDELRRRLAQCKADVIALRALLYGVVSQLQRHPVPGPEGSLIRLHYTQLVQRVYRAAMDMMGADGLDLEYRGGDGREWVRGFLFSFKETISGGTKDIQRNIIATRILELPRG